MRITFVTRKFGNVERDSHCDVLHITPIRDAILFLDCNGDFAIKAYTNHVGNTNAHYQPVIGPKGASMVLCYNIKRATATLEIRMSRNA